MTKIKTVFLDIDGVIANFLGGLHKALNVPYSYENYPYEKGKWDMLTDIGGFEDIPATFEQCNDCCTFEFWQNLLWMHDGRKIFNYISKRINLKQIFLLTTPMPNVESPTGKWLWVEKHLPDFKKRLIITQAPKSLFAQPNTLLIDDKDENVEGFRTAGGRAILIARPWNNAYANANKTYHKLRYDWNNNKDLEHKRDVRFRLLYGSSLKEYDKMFAEQKGCCAICGIHQSKTERRFHLDHDHKTRKIRGILCEPCNHFLGLAKDNPTILNQAATYLENTK